MKFVDCMDEESDILRKAEERLESLKVKWFQFPYRSEVKFLERYILLKKEFIKKLKETK